MPRRPMLAVIGDAGVKPGSIAYETALSVGRLAIDNGYRIVTGGLSGVMEAASHGAHQSDRYHEGDTVGILPHDNPQEASDWVDVVISTGMGHARNALVANADAVIVVGGGAGTLSEIAFAWTLRRLVIAIDIPGWGIKLAGAPLDKRVRYAELHDDKIYSATDPDEALTLIEVHLPKYSAWGRSFKTRK